MSQFHTHTGNRLEDLADALIDTGASADLHPLSSRVIICESRSLAIWLRHRFCHNGGIACLLDTQLPAAWLWEQARHILGLPREDDPLSREHMPWRLFAALAADSPLRSGDDMVKITRYLRDDDTGIKRWQLADRTADVFDRYQYYRPELIRNWSAGRENCWQARLWRAITEGTEHHRVELMDRFLKALDAPTAQGGLPPRVDLFAIHNLPPLLLNAFGAIAHHVPVHLWLLAPTPHYWADLESPRQMARKRRDNPHDATLWEGGNPLLTQWGRQGQIFQDMLLDDAFAVAGESEHFTEPGGDTLLHRLQADIYAAVDAPDNSGAEEPKALVILENESPLTTVQFHVCHGTLRECQVLHDTLLHCLMDDQNLQPEDILVLVPEISRYAPYIEAVFGSAEFHLHLPYNISDVIQADEHPLIRAFLDLLNLPESRFTRAEILGLANLPEVRRKFELDESDMEELAETFDTLRICWGLDGRDKARLHLPEIDDNTWHQGFRRIMAGFATGSEELLAIESPIAPLPRITAQNADRAARFFNLLDVLRTWMSRLQASATPREWSGRLGELIDALFAPGRDDEDRIERIREALGELAQVEGGQDMELSLDVIRHWLNETLGNQSEKGRFYRGGITFCAMKPLRGVPFQIIALLGMQEQAFPRRRTHSEFDLMKEGWRHGDPDPTQEDRYLFLEALLAARDKLIISYTGRDARTNNKLQPSTLVQELLDYLDERYRLGADRPSEVLTRVHALHPFGVANFTKSALGKQGFDKRWLAITRAIQNHDHPQPEKNWPTRALEAPEQRDNLITPQELAGFFKSPLKQFVHKRLRVYEPKDVELTEEEPFDLGGLETWQVRELLVRSWLRGDDDNAALQLVRAHGLLPHGTQGNSLFAQIHGEFDDIRRRCEEYGIQPPPFSTPINIDIPDLVANDKEWCVSGRINAIVCDNRLIEISASKYSLEKMLPLWVRHLCLHASGHTPELETWFFGQDKTVSLAPVEDCEQARKYLQALLALRETGLTLPLPFPERTAAAFIDKLQQTADESKACTAAIKEWKGDDYCEGEREKYHNRITLHGYDWTPCEDEVLAKYARGIFNPLITYLGEKE